MTSRPLLPGTPNPRPEVDCERRSEQIQKAIDDSVGDGEPVLPTQARLNRRVVLIEQVPPGANRQGVTVRRPVDDAHVGLKERPLFGGQLGEDLSVVVVAEAPLVVGEVLQHVKGPVHLPRHLHHQPLVSGGQEEEVEEVGEDVVREELDEEVARLAERPSGADRVARNGADQLDGGRPQRRLPAKVEYLAPGDGVLDAAGDVHHQLPRGGRLGGGVPGGDDQRVDHKVHGDDVRLEVAVH